MSHKFCLAFDRQISIKIEIRFNMNNYKLLIPRYISFQNKFIVLFIYQLVFIQLASSTFDLTIDSTMLYLYESSSYTKDQAKTRCEMFGGSIILSSQTKSIKSMVIKEAWIENPSLRYGCHIIDEHGDMRNKNCWSYSHLLCQIGKSNIAKTFIQSLGTDLTGTAGLILCLLEQKDNNELIQLIQNTLEQKIVAFNQTQKNLFNEIYQRIDVSNQKRKDLLNKI